MERQDRNCLDYIAEPGQFKYRILPDGKIVELFGNFSF
jgi:hypothetical protein